MSHIFISYSTKDFDFARHLRHLLQDQGFSVWMDETRLQAGQRWWDEIERNINACSAFIVIMSPDAKASEWVEREILVAEKREKPILPVLLSGEVWGRLANVQYEDMTLGMDAVLTAKFVKALEALTQVVSKSEAALPRFPKENLEKEIPEQSIRQAAVVSVTDILPPPFEWIEIPGGDVTLEKGGYVRNGGETYPVEPFRIAQYPITNAQYRVFVDAKGYTRREFWTEEGWQAKEGKNKESKPWDKPRSWNDARFNQSDNPVVGISWYEMIAFCNWLSEETNIEITLPTEQQWQRAAQGDDGRAYPWGNDFDTKRCNTKESNLGKTTPVTHYPEGASPYGVMDMGGNVSERCLNDWGTGEIDFHKPATKRVVRGGSCELPQQYTQTAHRETGAPGDYNEHTGFRICTESVSMKNSRSWLNEPRAIIIAAIITGFFAIITTIIIVNNQSSITPTPPVTDTTNTPTDVVTATATLTLTPTETLVATSRTASSAAVSEISTPASPAASVTMRVVINETSLTIYVENPAIALNSLAFITTDDETHSLDDYDDLRFFLNPGNTPVCLQIKTNNDATPLISECATPAIVGRTIVNSANVFWWDENQVSTRALQVRYDGQNVGLCAANTGTQVCEVSIPAGGN